MLSTFLTQDEVARRFRISPRTLERWRWLKTGPCYTKMGGKVLYAIADIETYERKRRAQTHVSVVGLWG